MTASFLTCKSYPGMAIVIDQSHVHKPFTRHQRCSFQSCSHLENNILELKRTSIGQAFEIANFHKSFSTPCLSVIATREEESERTPRIEIVGGSKAPKICALVAEAAIAMASGIDPLPISNGLGGAYFLCGRNGDKIAVAKPIDEEPLALHNPKGFGGLKLGQPGLKHSVCVGESGIRELAAYLLDHGGFANVPPTALVKISHVPFFHNNGDSTILHKIASLQRYVDHDYDAGELGSSGFSVDSVHRIGIFDVRLLNLDRHAGNILVKKYEQQNYAMGTAELVPIDHGLCLPEWLDDPYFEWLHWPQALVPFSESEAEYISNLDPFKDAEFLRNELPLIKESSVRVLVLCTIFLKRAAATGLCLAEIGKMMTREFHGVEESISVLEDICTKAKASTNDALDSEDYKRLKKQNAEEIGLIKIEAESEVNITAVTNLPRLIQSISGAVKPPKIPKFPFVKAGPLNAEFSTLYSELTNQVDYGGNNINTNVKNSYNTYYENKYCSGKAPSLAKSASFTAQNPNYKSEGIYFGDMTEYEWELFLQNFEKLLPDVFGDLKCQDMKHKLGTSCEF